MKNIKIIFCSFVLILLSVQSVMSMDSFFLQPQRLLTMIMNSLAEKNAKNSLAKRRLQLLNLCEKSEYDAAKEMLKDLSPEEFKKTVNFVDKICWSPLRKVVAQGEIDMTRWLVENGADVNIHSEGYTALNEAIKIQRIDIVALLLNHEADVTLGACITPLAFALNSEQIAQRYKNQVDADLANMQKIIELLKQYGARE